MRPAAAPSTLVVTPQNSSLATMTSRVDPEGARRMMEMMINLYADQRLAVVREYISNAVDATRVAGRTDPVMVTTPTLLEPNFIVTDRGVGMSTAEVEATFLAFAASTKRDTNELVGGLGVGAKSAWALTESFLIDTVKDGKRTLVRAARDLQHQVLLAGEPTDLPTGTTISVPVEVTNHTAEWNRVVAEVSSAHDNGAVMVDGKPVTSIAAGPARIGPVLCRGGRTTVMIRSGGTLFESVPAISNMVGNATGLNTCVVELPIGSFDHTPSRESIVATDRTTAAVNAAMEQFAAALVELKQRIDALAATDVAAAVTLRHSVVGKVAPYTVLPIDLSLRIPSDIGAWGFHSGARGRWARTSDVDRDDFTATSWNTESGRTLVVTGVPAGRKLRSVSSFVKENHSNIRRVIPMYDDETQVELAVTTPKGDLTGQTFTFDAAMVPESNRYTFEEWTAATAVQRKPRGAASGYFCVMVASDGADPALVELTGAQIAAFNLPVCFMEGDRPTRPQNKATKASIEVYLGKRKDGPLLAAVPDAMTRAEWRSVRFASLTAGWSNTDKIAVCARSSMRSDVKRRFTMAAEAGERIAAEGREGYDLLDRITELLAAMKAVSDEQVAAWETINTHDGARTPVTAIEELDGELKAAWPLLRHVSSYSDNGRKGEYLDYIACVPPRDR
jgi:hypothetical protein